MKKLIAKNATQLDKTLRWLYANDIDFEVNVVKTEKHKIIYEVLVKLDDQMYEKIINQLRLFFQ